MLRPKMGRQPRRLTADEAGEIAAAALLFLTEDAQRLQRFLTDTGMAPADLAAQAHTAMLAAAVLEHLLGDESLLLTFCSKSRIEPERVVPAHALLTGAGVA